MVLGLPGPAERPGDRLVIVGQENESVHARPRQDLVIASRRGADCGPMNSLETMLRQPLNPTGRQVHVDEQFHGRLRGTSTSSAR